MSDNTYTVEDQAGLDALPVGTLVYDRDGDEWEREWDGWRPLWIDVAAGYGLHNYLPAVVQNPEILGEFTSVTTSLEELDAEYRIEEGSIVEIVGANRALFAGVRAEVIRPAKECGSHRLRPLSERPDGFGFSPFYWSSNDVELVATVIEESVEDEEPESVEIQVGDHVRVIDNESNPHFKVGETGLVTNIYPEDNLPALVWLEGKGGLFDHRLEKLTEQEVAEIEAENERITRMAEVPVVLDVDALDALPNETAVSVSPDGAITAIKINDQWVRINRLDTTDAYNFTNRVRSRAENGRPTFVVYIPA